MQPQKIGKVLHTLFVESGLLQAAYEAAQTQQTAQSSSAEPQLHQLAAAQQESKHEDGSLFGPFRDGVDYISLLISIWRLEKGHQWARRAVFGPARSGPLGTWEASVVVSDTAREDFEDERIFWGSGQQKKAAQQQ